MAAALIDLTGRTFGRLTVLKRGANRYLVTGGMKVYWQCRCTCGTTVEVRGSSLAAGDTHSCGCLRRERRTEAR